MGKDHLRKMFESDPVLPDGPMHPMRNTLYYWNKDVISELSRHNRTSLVAEFSAAGSVPLGTGDRETFRAAYMRQMELLERWTSPGGERHLAP